MSSSPLSSMKKRKRGRSERIFKFKSFGENGHPVDIDHLRSFRHSVKKLLEYGNQEINNFCNGMSIWSFQLEVHRHPPLHVLLFVVEEPIQASLSLHCKHCQYVGWGHHMVCNKKYHFLLPSKETVAALFSDAGKCNIDSSISTMERTSLLELQTHAMHGVFHCNGFGHLLCINGIEPVSDLPGHQIMDLWDRICTSLRAKKVSLSDVSKKRGMELRLLHGMAYGKSWFGQWGYEFSRGCYGVTYPVYQKAVKAAQGMPLYLLNHYIGVSSHDIPIILTRYQTLADNSLATFGDLFHFMLQLQSRLPKENLIDSQTPAILVETSCRWSAKRVEAATRVIVETLEKVKFRWVSRQEVRDAARAYIGDTGLLDFVLKSLGNHVVGNYLIRRCLNPVTKVLEYCLEDVSNVFPNQDVIVTNKSKVIKSRYKITKAQLMKDIFYLYKHVLKEQKSTPNAGILSALPMAVRIILDTKHFVKEYNGEFVTKYESVGFNGKLKLFCTVMLRNNDDNLDHQGGKTLLLPYECVTLNENATFDDLKLEVENNFREIYLKLETMIVDSLVLNVDAKGTDLVSRRLETGQKIICLGSNNGEGILCEGGDNWVVDCPCGAKGDDGERFVTCDVCEVWQHCRCVGIPNNEKIPPIFLCKQCDQNIMLFPSLP